MGDFSGKIFIYGNGGGYFIYDKNKDQVISEDPDLTQWSFIEEDNVRYVKDLNTFKAIDSNSGTLIWEVLFDGGFSMGPTFTQDEILILTRADSHVSNLYSLSKKTGEVLWRKSFDLISNIDVKDFKVYAITSNGNLIVLDQKNGNELLNIKFSSQPFVLPSSSRADKLIGAYTVSADPKNNVVIISLGDSCELLAMKINQ